MESFKYTNIAFISYKREDEQWAKWLQKRLEHYKLPTEIRKQNPNLEFSEHPRHVFKDTTDLSGGTLAKAIKEGLRTSKFLIVICSPQAAKSEWVCKEVQDFIDSGREEYIIPFIIDGEPYAKDSEKECLPVSLKVLAGERELLGININENGRDSASVKVVARLFGLKFDTLWDRFQREKKRKRRNVLFSLIALIIFLLCVIVGALYAYVEVQRQKQLVSTVNVELLAANDSIKNAYAKLELTEKRLSIANNDLENTNINLLTERNRVFESNQKILQQRSRELGNLAYNYIEDGNTSDAAELIKEVLNHQEQYVYTSQIEKALRRYFNYFEQHGIKLIENKYIIGQHPDERPGLVKYGFNPTFGYFDEIYDYNKGTISIVNNEGKLLLELSIEEFESANIWLSNDEKTLITEFDNKVSVWDIEKKERVYYGHLDDIYRQMTVQNMDNKRFCIFGKNYFSIYDYSDNTLRLERRIDYPEYAHFLTRSSSICYDDINKTLFYQGRDSCLIAQSVESGEILEKRKIDGIITHISINNIFPPFINLAISYTIERKSIWEHDQNRMEIYLFPDFYHLYKMPLLSSHYVSQFMYSSSGYLYALTSTIGSGKSHLYVWDAFNINRKPKTFFNYNKTYSMDYQSASKKFDKILFVLDDSSIVYINENNKKYPDNRAWLCLYDAPSDVTDTLSISSNRYILNDIQVSSDGQYIVGCGLDGCWVYDRVINKKNILTDQYSNISISPDGRKIAYTEIDENNGQENIIVCDVKIGGKSIISLSQHIRQLQLSKGGTKLLFLDENYCLYDFNLESKELRVISVDAIYTDCFGFSDNGNYIYCVFRRDNIEKESHYLKIWKTETLDVVMENVLSSNPHYIRFEGDGDIYTISGSGSEIIPFNDINELILKFNENEIVIEHT